jgi:PAS domain S-box-containing protein
LTVAEIASETEPWIGLAVQAARIGAWDWDLQRGALVISAMGKSIYGLPRDRPATFEDLVAVIHPEDLPGVIDSLQRAIDPAIRAETPYEYRIIRPDGEVRNLLVHGHGSFDSTPTGVRAVRYVGAIQDVTEQRRIDARNRAVADRLRLAIQAGKMGAFEYDFATGDITCDGPQLEILGLSPAEAPRTLEQARRLVDPRDLSQLEALVREACIAGASFSMDFRIIRPSGAAGWCAANASVIRDGLGKPTRLFGYAVDITERRRTETELAERQAMLQSLLDAEALFIAVVEVVDDGYVVLTANQAAAAFYDLQPGQTRKHALELGDPPEKIKFRRAFLMDVWTRGTPQTVEHAFSRRGEARGWCVATYTPLAASPEGRPRLSVVLIDITARKLADERQQLIVREVDHRAKNALAVAQAVVELTDDADPAAFKRSVVGRVSAIARVHSLLAGGRSSGVDLRRLVEDELAPYATDRPGRLIVEGPAHDLSPASGQLVGLIVHELATNAVKYGALRGADGRLEVRWSTPPGGALEFVWTEITVEPAPVEPPAGKGFGLRLLEQTISRQLGGAWSTRWKDSGLVFAMSLPLSSAPPVATAGSAPPPPGAGGRKRVLVAEDEPLIALELESVLVDLGFHVAGRCGTLSEAAAAAEAGPDVAILDVNLGGETTFALAERLRRDGARVIFCTGYAALDLPPELADAPVLVKPVRQAVLVEALERLTAPA